MNGKEKDPSMLAHGKACFLASADFLGGSSNHLNHFNDSAYLHQNQDSMNSIQLAEEELCRKFAPKRLSAELLSQSYARLGYDRKAEAVGSCGTLLEFAYEISSLGDISEKGKLSNANFCKDRLCPMCSWRRSYKIFAQVSQIMSVLDGKYEYLFLTLTVPSVSGESLPSTIDRLMKAWFRFSHYKRFEKSIKGFFRALEVTRNKDILSPSYGLYHPHFHVVLAVPKRYFKSELFIPHDEWLNLWRKAYKDDSITQVDIRKARDKHKKYDEDSKQAVEDLSSAVAEIAKYPLKSGDYLIPDNPGFTDEAVKSLSTALRGRRLIAYGGCFKDAYESLRLDDAESTDTDLVHINETLRPDVAYLIVRYGWSTGAYKMVNSFVRESGSPLD